ncbi:MAG: hypothetical protein CR982_10165 [Candidatus Cloacimonadota bacterium]|nr:MAG: hypothetical protein CR982_10165 [Candidatus Cloacimonadota bacterium]PIE78516.1 MAG: hypothetical protein CSA15_07425 [Candidatus Delongbacteria bacterium]
MLKIISSLLLIAICLYGNYSYESIKKSDTESGDIVLYENTDDDLHQIKLRNNLYYYTDRDFLFYNIKSGKKGSGTNIINVDYSNNKINYKVIIYDFSPDSYRDEKTTIKDYVDKLSEPIDGEKIIPRLLLTTAPSFRDTYMYHTKIFNRDLVPTIYRYNSTRSHTSARVEINFFDFESSKKYYKKLLTHFIISTNRYCKKNNIELYIDYSFQDDIKQKLQNYLSNYFSTLTGVEFNIKFNYLKTILN